MNEFEKAIKFKNNVFVANLIKAVLASKMTVADALIQFPHDSKDMDFKCAFDALAHREADEDIRKDDPEYAALQDEYLLNISNILSQNKIIPRNIVANYLEYHRDNVITDMDWKPSLRNIIISLKRMISF